MAKRKVRRARSRSYSPFKRRSRGRSTGNGSLMPNIIGGAGYGVIRAKLSQVLAPYTAKLGVAGQFADELALGTLAYIGAKKLSGIGKDISKAALTVESFSIGSTVGSNFLGGSTSQPKQSAVVYG